MHETRIGRTHNLDSGLAVLARGTRIELSVPCYPTRVTRPQGVYAPSSEAQLVCREYVFGPYSCLRWICVRVQFTFSLRGTRLYALINSLSRSIIDLFISLSHQQNDGSRRQQSRIDSTAISTSLLAAEGQLLAHAKLRKWQ